MFVEFLDLVRGKLGEHRATPAQRGACPSQGTILEALHADLQEADRPVFEALGAAVIIEAQHLDIHRVAANPAQQLVALAPPRTVTMQQRRSAVLAGRRGDDLHDCIRAVAADVLIEQAAHPRVRLEGVHHRAARRDAGEQQGIPADAGADVEQHVARLEFEPGGQEIGDLRGVHALSEQVAADRVARRNAQLEVELGHARHHSLAAEHEALHQQRRVAKHSGAQSSGSDMPTWL